MFPWITSLFRRSKDKPDISKNISLTAFASGRSGDLLVFGRCSVCKKLLDHTPIQVPIRPPSPNPGHPGDYYVEFTHICYRCVYTLTKPHGVFERSLLDGLLEPKTLWTTQIFEGKQVAAIEENTRAARKNRFTKK